MNNLRNWLLKRFHRHITINVLGRDFTIYGFNAMHVAMEFRTKKFGWICFHPPIHFLGWNWPWYFYVSPNGTPCCSTFAIGPGVDHSTKRLAKIRREMFGHNFDAALLYNGLYRELLG